MSECHSQCIFVYVIVSVQYMDEIGQKLIKWKNIGNYFTLVELDKITFKSNSNTND